MENNDHEQFRTLAEAKSRADNSDHSIISPSAERIIRFYWWIIAGICLAVIMATTYVVRSEIRSADVEKRITANEAYRDTTKARFTADDLTHVQTNQQIAAIQSLLTGSEANSPSRIKQVDDMWQMKIRGESNKEAFFREHGYAAPMGLGETRTPPPSIASSPVPTQTPR